jgi:hypothetical protein
MDQDTQRQPSASILQALAKLFRADAHDRHVYCVFGPYERLWPFQKRLRKQVAQGSFNERGLVHYLSLNREIVEHMKSKGSYDHAVGLARRRMDVEFRQILSESFRDLVTSRIEAKDTLGLVLADFELLYAYDLGNHDIPIARQVAINGKRVCLLVPGQMRDRRLWIFDDDPESRCEFPDALVFKNSGWVFELAD